MTICFVCALNERRKLTKFWQSACVSGRVNERKWENCMDILKGNAKKKKFYFCYCFCGIDVGVYELHISSTWSKHSLLRSGTQGAHADLTLIPKNFGRLNFRTNTESENFTVRNVYRPKFCRQKFYRPKILSPLYYIEILQSTSLDGVIY